ncbi:MAG: hypothetical protein WBY53_00435 [Acidobacteriaceae bacterium]
MMANSVSNVLRSVGVALCVVLFVTQSAEAMPVLLAGSSANMPRQQVAPAAPVPSDVLNAKKVFVGNAGSSPELYSRFVADLTACGRYTLVGSPAQADLVFEFHDEPLSVVMVEPSTQVVLTTVTAPYVPPQRDQDQEATISAQNLVTSIKQLIGAPLSTQDMAGITPPPPMKHGRLLIGIIIGGSLAIAGGIVLLLHGRGH